MSEASKHTPGPWEIAHPGTADQSVFARVTMSGKTARMFICSIDTTEVDEWPEQAAANAALIAAAPETTECLRAWCLIHSDPEFAAKTDLEKAEIRSTLWLSSIAALAKAGVHDGSPQADQSRADSRGGK